MTPLEFLHFDFYTVQMQMLPKIGLFHKSISQQHYLHQNTSIRIDMMQTPLNHEEASESKLIQDFPIP